MICLLAMLVLFTNGQFRNYLGGWFKSGLHMEQTRDSCFSLPRGARREITKAKEAGRPSCRAPGQSTPLPWVGLAPLASPSLLRSPSDLKSRYQLHY